MFTKKVTDSDAFIEMSSATQALYFHLNQSADDDGFNNQIQIAMIKAHASVDDLKVLLMKNFIIRFESGVIVIKHWRMHNTLRKDRYTPTSFQEELNCLKIKENASYTLLDDGCQTVAKRLPQYSIDKYSIDKSSNTGEKSPDYQFEFNQLWETYPNKKGKQDALRHYIKARKAGVTPKEVSAGIAAYCADIEKSKIEPRYVKHGSTFFHEKAWEDSYDVEVKEKLKDTDETDDFLSKYGG